MKGISIAAECISAVLKANNLAWESDWDDKGCRVFTTADGMGCPLCKQLCIANVEHLCGDRVPKEKVKKSAKRSAAKPVF